jgi:NADH dehydrogenase
MAVERFFLELDPPSSLPSEAPHVVIVGGGFAGLKAAHALVGRAARVTLIDRHNFNLFQPLLYQVATGLVAQSDVASPLRQLVGQASNVQVLIGEVVDLDTQAREVVFNDRRYRYDHLILATGATSSFFGHDAWGEMSIPMKSLADAERIQHRVLSALEEAEQTPDAARRELLQSVVVIGGGPTGCELAASLLDLLRHTLARDFKQLDPQRCRVTLVDPGDRVLRAMDPELSRAAGEHLRRRGVELLLGGRVKAIEANRVVLTLGEQERSLEAGTICWTAGVVPSPLGQLLAERSGCPLDMGGRVIVEPDCSLPGARVVLLEGNGRRYRVSAPLAQWMWVRVVGWGATRPVLVLAPATPGYADAANLRALVRVIDAAPGNASGCAPRADDGGNEAFGVAVINVDVAIGAPSSLGGPHGQKPAQRKRLRPRRRKPHQDPRQPLASLQRDP